MNIICENCQITFNRNANEVNRSIRNGRKIFCSLKCAGEYKTLNKPVLPPNAICSYCGIKFRKRKTKSKSGLYFCCREHKDLAQRIGGIQEIMPSHYGVSNNHNRYRKIAFDNYPNKCNRCDYNLIPVLQVHHIDRDRTNNHPDNLEILCPTHHFEEHYFAKDGIWS